MSSEEVLGNCEKELKDIKLEFETLKAYCDMQENTIMKYEIELNRQKENYDQEIDRILNESEKAIKRLETEVNRLNTENKHLQVQNDKFSENVKDLVMDKNRL